MSKTWKDIFLPILPGLRINPEAQPDNTASNISEYSVYYSNNKHFAFYQLTSGSSIREMARMQNRRLRNWRIANLSDCNGDKYIRCAEGEVKHRPQSRSFRRHVYLPARLLRIGIINIIIVMSMVGNATSAFYTSRIYTSEATALHMLTSTIKQRCFMLSESRLSRQRKGEETTSRNASQDMRSLGWTKKKSSVAQRSFFSHTARFWVTWK